MLEHLRLPWDSTITQHYGHVRADMERRGKILAPLDLLIATHALSVGALLETNDQAFHQVADCISKSGQIDRWQSQRGIFFMPDILNVRYFNGLSVYQTSILIYCDNVGQR